MAFTASFLSLSTCLLIRMHHSRFIATMGKRKQVSSSVKAAVIALSEHTSKTQKEIASDCSISQNTVSYILKRYRETGKTEVKSRSGRPPKTSFRTDNRIHRIAKKNPFVTSSEIKRIMSPDIDHITTRTIRNRLCKKFRLKARTPRRKPLITTKARRKRLAWCKEHANWTVNDWKKVTFSDESTFLQFQEQHQYVRRPPGSLPTNELYTDKTVKHSPSIMVWGCFSHHGRGGLSILEKGVRLNSEKYINILEEKVIPFMNISRTVIFQQDNAPCHSSRKTKKWFEENGIEVLDWPGNSPDLNPIENLWRSMKVKVNAKRHSNVHDLIQNIKQAWIKVSQNECQRLVESMPRRIQSVLQNNGYPTKY